MLERAGDAVGGVRGLGDRLDAFLAVEEQPQPGADDRVVVDDHDTQRLCMLDVIIPS